MSRKENYSFRSADDLNTTIHAVEWLPENEEVKATLQIVHGMQEYIERYDEFARFLADRGFAVFGHDHIGHGLSVSGPEDLGKMHSAHPDDTMIRDMFTNYKRVRSRYQGIPHFILGHSMGSYLLRKFLAVYSGELTDLNGAIIMGTGAEPDVNILFGRIICSLVIAIKGRDALSPFVRKLMFSSGGYRQFDATGLYPEKSWLSKNVENVKEFMDPDNPKTGYEFSLNGYRVLLASTWFDNRMPNIKKMNKDIPVIFVSGDQDPVGAMGKGVRKAYSMFKRARVKDLSIKLYKGDRHEILNELDRDRVYNDLYDWMRRRM